MKVGCGTQSQIRGMIGEGRNKFEKNKQFRWKVSCAWEKEKGRELEQKVIHGVGRLETRIKPFRKKS